MLDRTETQLAHLLERVGADQYVDPARAVRFAEWSLVGLLGAVLDLSVTITTLPHLHYLLANGLGFVLAVSWNFSGNWLITYDRPDGTLARQFASYVGLHAVTFGIRGAVLVVLVEAAGTDGLTATLVAVGVAAVSNFVGTERIFGGAGHLWFDAIAALNQTAHAVYSSRLRSALQQTGLYTILYGLYLRAFGLLYREDQIDIEHGDATATLYMETAPEVVSVMHSLEKEQHILETFVGELRPDDICLDVGANLGVYTCLAADAAHTVTAVEPHPPTVARLRENVALNDYDETVTVVDGALAATTGTATLATERDEVGTQTPYLTEPAFGGLEVPQYRGDDLVRGNVPPPTVVKIDVEGAELGVLAGLEDTLASCRLVLCEVHHDAVGKAVQNWFEIRGWQLSTIHATHTQTYLLATNND